MPHSQTYTVRWAELDPNGHMRHSAYADFAADQRVHWLTGAGYDGALAPWDAEWGMRYAVVHDPDGTPVDLFAPLPGQLPS